MREAEPGECGLDHEGAVVDHDAPGHGYLEVATALGELPAIERAITAAILDAVVLVEIARMRRPRTLREVGGRSDDGTAEVGTDAHADHVALDHLADANPGIE